MASAEKRTVTEEVVTQVEKEVINLELSIEEALVLREVTGSIGGSMETRVRKVCSPLFHVLDREVGRDVSIDDEIVQGMRVDSV